MVSCVVLRIDMDWNGDGLPYMHALRMIGAAMLSVV
jgi:hypothetical protein